jgi:hypothetical protein
MRAIVGFMFVGLVLPAVAQDRPVEIDPNTRIQGGADVRGSGANAGAGARPDNKIESDTRVGERGNVAGPDKGGHEKDKPISERKPQEREPEDASKGGTRPTQ